MSRRHARAEAMGTLAAGSVGLIGPFHDRAPHQTAGSRRIPGAPEDYPLSGRGSIAAASYPVKPKDASPWNPHRPQLLGQGRHHLNRRAVEISCSAPTSKKIRPRFPSRIDTIGTFGPCGSADRSGPASQFCHTLVSGAVFDPDPIPRPPARTRPKVSGWHALDRHRIETSDTSANPLAKPTCEPGATESRLRRRQYETALIALLNSSTISIGFRKPAFGLAIGDRPALVPHDRRI